jgi:undecaprenyl-diphosphatase
MAGFIAFFDDVEGDICLRINRLSHRTWLRRFFSIVSKLGDGGFWALLAAALYLVQGPQALP